jgi:hypothetical protein
MPELYGKKYSITDLRKRTGSMSQIAGIRSSTLNDGHENGVRVLDFYTGSGFRFTVLPDRGMDIGAAEWQGVPLVWHSSTGMQHPAYYEQEGMGWLRGFYGGLMVTCGFMNVAVASEDQGEFYGIHGRASYLPAQNVSYDAEWQGDDYVLTARGKVRETRLFGENILLTRTISTRLGSRMVSVTDVIENQGFESTPMMVLYHINAGFPVLDENSRVYINSQVTPRDEEASKWVRDAKRGSPPIHALKDQVHQHHVTPDADGWGSAALVNHEFNHGEGIGLHIRYHAAELPYFWQWRMVGEGNYVMGLEPANCHVMGRGEERRQGRLPMMEPGEVRTHRLELSVLATPEDFEKLSR